MQEVTLDTLAQRMNQLERKVRRWRLGATMLLTCAVAVLVMGQTMLPKAQVIEAQRFILKSPDGTVRAILGQHEPHRKISPTGESWNYMKTSDLHEPSWGLHLFGPDRRYRAGLASSYAEDVQSTGGYLLLVDKTTVSAVELSAGNGHASLLMHATTQTSEERDKYYEKTRVVNTMKENEETSALFKPYEHTFSTLLTSKGRTVLTLGEKDGDVALGGVDEQHPFPLLVFRDKYNQVIWKAP